ncbi:ankyrin, partial [Acephala macrosclerotiorum]
TPLHCAVLKRSRSIVLLLLEHAGSNKDSSFLDVNSRDSGGGNTPLHLAARTSRTDIVRILLNHGADLYLKNTSGLTPFHQCLLSGGPEFVRSFLDAAGVSSLIHIPDADGNTALHLAAKFASSEIVELLLDYGASVNSINREGDTALNLATAATHSDV